MKGQMSTIENRMSAWRIVMVQLRRKPRYFIDLQQLTHFDVSISTLRKMLSVLVKAHEIEYNRVTHKFSRPDITYSWLAEQ